MISQHLRRWLIIQPASSLFWECPCISYHYVGRPLGFWFESNVWRYVPTTVPVMYCFLTFLYNYNPEDTSGWINVGLTLVHRLRRWTNVKPTLIQRLMSAGM